jgi:hypothetical protein
MSASLFLHDDARLDQHAKLRSAERARLLARCPNRRNRIGALRWAAGSALANLGEWLRGGNLVGSEPSGLDGIRLAR